MAQNKNRRRIGIFAGAFNPVHSGHISFALQAMEAAQLDQIYFLPERQPRHKDGVEHFGHRVAMLHRALRPHPRLKVLELVDVRFSVVRTLPQLQRLFPRQQLVFLFGSDAVMQVPAWPNGGELLKSSELVVGLRGNESQAVVVDRFAEWPYQPVHAHILSSYAPQISSYHVREGLYRRRSVPGLLSSVERYSNLNWLYVSLV